MRLNDSVFDLDGTPECFLFCSMGRLLKGNEINSKQYTELAKQLDAKRSAFYLELKEEKIIIGCSLKVEADRGRDERVVFIQIYNNLPPQNINLDGKSLTAFYKGVKSKIGTLGLEEHRLVGFWEDEDTKNINDLKINNNALNYIILKIYSDKKVSVQISEFRIGFTYFKLIPELVHKRPLIIDVFRNLLNTYDYNSDIELNIRGRYKIFNQLPPENQSILSEESVIDETSNSDGNQYPLNYVSDDIYKVEIFLRSSNNDNEFNDNSQTSLNYNVNLKSESKTGENEDYHKTNSMESENHSKELDEEDETSISEGSQYPSYYMSDNKSEVEIFKLSSNNYNSAYGIYNSTGQLLRGNERFEQYTELAKQLDAKRSAFYLELREDKIIFGCSLSVKAGSGREERVVFIQIHNNLPKQYKITKCNIQSLKNFYEDIKSEIETLNLNKYQLVGLWEELDYKNIKSWTIHNDYLNDTVDEIQSGRNVSVKISGLSGGLSFILKTITTLYQKHKRPLIFNVSQYPSNSDVSVSLIRPNPDFEIEENGDYRKNNAMESLGAYKESGQKSVKNKTSNLITNSEFSDLVNLVTKEILDKPNNLSFYKYKEDLTDVDKVEVFKKLATEVYDTNDPINKVLTEIYHNIKSSERRKDIYEITLSKNIYIKDLANDLVKSTYKEKNKDLFNLLLKYSGNELAEDNKKSSKYSSSEEIEKSLKDLKYSEKIDFVKYIASESISSSKSKVEILLNPLIEDLVMQDINDFISKLTEEEAKNLDDIQGSNYLGSKEAKKKKNRSIKIKIASYAVVLVLIVLLSYFAINYIH